MKTMKNVSVKRIAFLFLLLAILLSCTACGGGSGNGAASGTATATEVPAIINQAEYLLYQNIFYNGYGSQYQGQEVTKQGVFTSLQDAYNNVTRYYVWGYLDNTLCCDWQWEIKVDDEKNLPAPGSLVTVKGTFTADDAALDGYWITKPQIETVSLYVGETADIDMRAMSDTLERVQLSNVIRFPDVFEGKKFSAYGRIASETILEDPYYDGSWQVPFTAKAATLPAFGTTVVLRGTIMNGVLSASSLTVLK